MIFRVSISCIIVLAVTAGMLTPFKQTGVVSSALTLRDSTDSIVQVNVQKNISQYGQVISDYNGKEFSRDSLQRQVDEVAEHLAADSHKIKESVLSLLSAAKLGDTVQSEILFKPFFTTLKAEYSDLISHESIFLKVNKDLSVIKKGIIEIEPTYLSASQIFSKSIPENYTGKLHLVYKGKAYTVFISNSNVHDVVINKSDPSGRTLRKVWSSHSKDGKKPIAILNGGMFNGDYSPTGLLIENSQKIAELNTKQKDVTGNFFLFPNGIFLVDSASHFHVLETKAFIKRFGETKYHGIKYATQSGPMLLANNKIHGSFTNGSANLNIRNAVGVNSKFPSRVIFAISDDQVNFYDFAVLFKEVLRCDNALYLDGAVSRMYIDYKGIRTGKLDAELELGPMVIISRKNMVQ